MGISATTSHSAEMMISWNYRNTSRSVALYVNLCCCRASYRPSWPRGCHVDWTLGSSWCHFCYWPCFPPFLRSAGRYYHRNGSYLLMNWYLGRSTRHDPAKSHPNDVCPYIRHKPRLILRKLTLRSTFRWLVFFRFFKSSYTQKNPEKSKKNEKFGKKSKKSEKNLEIRKSEKNPNDLDNPKNLKNPKNLEKNSKNLKKSERSRKFEKCQKSNKSKEFFEDLKSLFGSKPSLVFSGFTFNQFVVSRCRQGRNKLRGGAE